MIGVLLAKDLRRAWRNPLPWVIFLALPLCVTALIGLAFGGKSDGGARSDASTQVMLGVKAANIWNRSSSIGRLRCARLPTTNSAPY